MRLTELKLLREIRRIAGRRGKGVRVGIGDDCAVLELRPGEQTLVTTDLSLEGVHFRREWHPPHSVGHRCLARGLSDIAAMGGEPRAVFLSLALPQAIPDRWVRGFFSGLRDLATRYRVTLAGGDLAESPQQVAADIAVVGAIPAGKALLRSGARPGDAIYVTGNLGGAAAALRRLYAEPPRRPLSSARARSEGYFRHFYPCPRVEVGRFLRARATATSMIDVSDGLSSDLMHICEESGVGAVIHAGNVPVFSGATIDQALHGGEDYELLFTSSKRIPRTIQGVPVTRIGEVLRGRKMWLVTARGQTEFKPQGWQHFSTRP